MTERSKPPRLPTHFGDRNEDMSHVPSTPRGVGLTEPPVNQLAVPHEIEEVKTGVTQAGPALTAERIRRATDDPPAEMAHLGARIDELERQLAESKAELAENRAERESLLKRILDMAEKGFSAKLALGAAAGQDVLDARKARRKLIAKIVGGVVGGGGAIEFLHRIGVL